VTILKCIGLKAWKSFICKFDGNNVNKLQNLDTIFKKLSSKNVQRIYYQNFDVDDQAEQGAVKRELITEQCSNIIFVRQIFSWTIWVWENV